MFISTFDYEICCTDKADWLILIVCQLDLRHFYANKLFIYRLFIADFALDIVRPCVFVSRSTIYEYEVVENIMKMTAQEEKRTKRIINVGVNALIHSDHLHTNLHQHLFLEHEPRLIINSRFHASKFNFSEKKTHYLLAVVLWSTI